MTKQQNSSIEIVEVGARDGLQNEKTLISTADKLSLIKGVLNAGIKRLEVASFVHPKLVPQMADAEDVVTGLSDLQDVTYIGLVLNKRGYMRALATNESKRGIDEIGCVVCASDSFGTKNQGQTAHESVEEAKAIVKLAQRDGLRAQVTISVAFGCPFEGNIPIEKVLAMAEDLAAENPCEIAIADTIGVAAPHEVSQLVSRLTEKMPTMPIRAHFHNTRGTGLANAWAAYSAGASILDSSLGGLGGCPFAPGATGNIASEDLLYMLKRSGIETGVSLDKLIELSQWMAKTMDKPLPSMLTRAGDFSG